MSKSIQELCRQMREFVKDKEIVIVTPHAPEPPVRRVPWQDPPEIFIIDYLDIIKPKE